MRLPAGFWTSTRWVYAIIVVYVSGAIHPGASVSLPPWHVAQRPVMSGVTSTATSATRNPSIVWWFGSCTMSGHVATALRWDDDRDTNCISGRARHRGDAASDGRLHRRHAAARPDHLQPVGRYVAATELDVDRR